MTSKDVTADFIDNWDLEKIMEPIVQNMPTFSMVFEAAAESKISKQKVKAAKSKNRKKGMYILHAGIHFLCSLKSSKVQVGLGLAAWASGASKEVMMVLHHSCLSMSYSSINSIVTSLADSAIEKAQKAASGPHALAYDNINILTSIFVEQKPGMPNKVQSGTFAVSLPMTLEDTVINICNILFKHVNGFEQLKDSPLFQHPPWRTIPIGHKTKFYPLRAMTIEEASVDGNLAIHNDIYTVQLDMDPENLNKRVIPCINDQLTNARIRGAQDQRRKNVSAWERREIFQLAFGTFHLVMNLIWSILSIHCGTVQQAGSLAYFFSIMEKTRLGSDHPDYHTLLTALTQILEGLILNAWQQECGQLHEFVATDPSLDNPKVPLKNLDMNSNNSNSSSSESEGEPDTEPSMSGPTPDKTIPKSDAAHENVVLLTRDFLNVIELVNAIQTGNFGHVEDMLPTLACMFHGAGSNNYSTEILHLLHNIKNVWTPEFTNIMCDNMLVNISGLPGHAMAMDLNIEHLIGYLKRLFVAKGVYSNWDHFGNISAAIPHLQTIKRQVAKSTDASRIDGDKVKAVIDVHNVGYKKFESSTLAAFNKKIQESKDGIPPDYEVDDIAPIRLTTNFADGEDEFEAGEESALHEDTE
ncbi:hypothetical protein CPB84DRAFT_1744923 [Gymnopilus junonius]|uniref:DUF6589 domain-containing protein n=1 Tax=Gymnopilus junonius TaxID=109634 RepID=A0A9P5TQ71_GYMJU|nr:hypothetical protein CPB84DRAFT_1744923 [Gymnopilus junonius]